VDLVAAKTFHGRPVYREGKRNSVSDNEAKVKRDYACDNSRLPARVPLDVIANDILVADQSMDESNKAVGLNRSSPMGFGKRQ
jgi:hypothetical protein